MDSLAAAHDAAVQMIDTSIVRVHQHAATRYDKLAANYLAFIKLASIRLWLRVYEFTALSSNRVLSQPVGEPGRIVTS